MDQLSSKGNPDSRLRWKWLLVVHGHSLEALAQILFPSSPVVSLNFFWADIPFFAPPWRRPPQGAWPLPATVKITLALISTSNY